MNQSHSIVLQKISVIREGRALLQDVSLTLNQGEQWAVTGPAGSGKTLLTLCMAGEMQFSGTLLKPEGLRLQRVAQQHQFLTRSHTRDFYYQQRYQSSDAEDALTIREALAPLLHEDRDTTMRLIAMMHLTASIDKPLIQLSNGENKRLQLIAALVRKPDLLILDNPFTGLDREGRAQLHDFLNGLAAEGCRLLLIAPVNELPDCITHVVQLREGRVMYSGVRSEAPPIEAVTAPAIQLLPQPDYPPFTQAVEMKEVNITYGEKEILRNINWSVHRGSRWLVSGPNGAGKSTLLSLITADNPQAYANNISLFDKRRGKGESIWDIKKKIGYVSPELHLFFEQGLPAFSVVASGLFDTIGLFRKLSAEEEARTQQWIDVLALNTIQQQPLFRLSAGQQRMVLLARALVKNPPLLILDEPCQGLDEEQTLRFNLLIDELCGHFSTTLIYVSHYSQQIPSCIHQFLELENGVRIR